MTPSVITAIIAIAIIVIAIVIVLTILVYNQMLLLNEVNKRLLLMAKDSIEKERNTTEELNDALKELDSLVQETPTNNTSSLSEDAFNPHTFEDPDLD